MKVLVVDDERAVRNSLRRAFTMAGYDVAEADGGESAVSMLARSSPDVVVLDVLMPDVDGLEVCRRMRAGGDRTPVVMVTARETVADRVAGLDAGADDYVVKPFDLDELLARVRALLRRSANGDSALLEFGDVTLDRSAREAARGDRRIDLTLTEYNLLELFMHHPRQVLTRGQIYERVWDYDFGPLSNSLSVYIGYLRRKLEAGGEPRLIQTVRGMGYVLREPAK